MTLRALDLFCGAVGGWSRGIHRIGIRTVAACEIDPWRRAVFAAQFPDAVMYSDVRDLTADRLYADLGYLPDIVVGSPPCQEISAANTKGKGITDDHLFWEWARLVFDVRPVWCAAENSSQARTSGIDGILAALDQAGYAAWCAVVGCDHIGAPHERRRMWLVAADAAQRLTRSRSHVALAEPGGRASSHAADAGERGRVSGLADIHSRQPDIDRGDTADPNRPRHAIRPRIAGNDGVQLPPALGAIGRAWPDWHGGLAGLSAACALAGAGHVDDGGRPGLPAGMRNRAIAALGDAVVPEIPEMIARSMLALLAPAQGAAA